MTKQHGYLYKNTNNVGSGIVDEIEHNVVTPPVLYEDCYVTCTDTELILKGYYFPTGSSKTIRRTEIARVWWGTDPDLGLSSGWKTKTWGMAWSTVWWAYGAGRELGTRSRIPITHNFVVATKHSFFVRHGFSVERNPQQLQALLQLYRPEHATGMVPEGRGQEETGSSSTRLFPQDDG